MTHDPRNMAFGDDNLVFNITDGRDWIALFAEYRNLIWANLVSAEVIKVMG